MTPLELGNSKFNGIDISQYVQLVVPSSFLCFCPIKINSVLKLEQLAVPLSLLCFCFLKINSVLRLNKMGGKSIRSEPQVLIISDAAREILVRAGWIAYLKRLQ